MVPSVYLFNLKMNWALNLIDKNLLYDNFFDSLYFYMNLSSHWSFKNIFHLRLQIIYLLTLKWSFNYMFVHVTSLSLHEPFLDSWVGVVKYFWINATQWYGGIIKKMSFHLNSRLIFTEISWGISFKYQNMKISSNSHEL